jgi:hypothetical protein
MSDFQRSDAIEFSDQFGNEQSISIYTYSGRVALVMDHDGEGLDLSLSTEDAAIFSLALERAVARIRGSA